MGSLCDSLRQGCDGVLGEQLTRGQWCDVDNFPGHHTAPGPTLTNNNLFLKCTDMIIEL